MGGRHPNMEPGDYAVVEDPATGRLVSASCLISYTIELEGISLPFGRPEVVATHPAYRNRGLVRAIFELLHARSEARGQVVQGITGIPYYYKLFGYEYAADLGGERSVPFAAVPPLKAGETEPYTLRPVTAADLPLVRELYDQDRARYGASTRIEDAYWCWLLTGLNKRSGEGWTPRLIVDAAGTVVGYVLTGNSRETDEVSVRGMGVRAGVSLAAVVPSLLRAMVAVAAEPLPRRSATPVPGRVCFALFRDHPAYRVLGENQVSRATRPYAWYLRVAHLPAFVTRIHEVLERRLAASPMAGHTGELRLTFYPAGLKLAFEDGRLVTAEDWREDHAWGPRSMAGFPPGVFLRLLFGYRSLSELRDAYPDVQTNDEARPLLEALFPPRPTWILPLD